MHVVVVFLRNMLHLVLSAMLRTGLLVFVLVVLLLPGGPGGRFPRFACAFILVPVMEDATHVQSTTFHFAEIAFDAALAAAASTGKSERHLSILSHSFSLETTTSTTTIDACVRFFLLCLLVSECEGRRHRKQSGLDELRSPRTALDCFPRKENGVALETLSLSPTKRVSDVPVWIISRLDRR